MKALITGSTGFIGSHLTKYLTKENCDVISLIHDRPIWTKWMKDSLLDTTRVLGDVRDLNFLKRVVNHYEIDVVIHLAAQSIVKVAHKDPKNTYDINIMGTVNVLEACRQLDVDKVIVQSTDKVYGNQTNATVDDKFVPTEPYGTSKICADVIAQSFIDTYDMNIAITRCCFFPRTKVHTKEGYEEINKIKPGDYVWTHKGRLRRVTNKSKRIYRGDFYTIILPGHRPDGRHNRIGFTCTPEHPILSEDGWIKAMDIEENIKVSVIASKCEWCGLPIPVWHKYCNRSCASLAFHRKEEYSESREKWLRSTRKAARKPERIRKILKKSLKTKGMTLDEYYVDLLIQKVVPDTFEYVGNGEVLIGTRCPDWISNDRKKIIEYIGNPTYAKRKDGIEKKKEYYEEQGYEILFLIDFKHPRKMEEQILNFVSGNHKFTFVPIKEIIKRTTFSWPRRKAVSVYNLEVEEDHSYIVSDCVVHNCNVYGYDWNNRIVPNTITTCLQRRMPIIFKNDLSTRQYIHISDVMKTFDRIIRFDITGIVIIATKDVLNQKQVVLEILKHFPGLEPHYVTKPPLKEIVHQSMVPDYPEMYTPFRIAIKVTIEQFKKYWRVR